MQDNDPQDTRPDFERPIQDALDSLPLDLRSRMSNVEVVVEDEPQPGRPLLGGRIRRIQATSFRRGVSG